MRRREFLGLACSGLAAWSPLAHAQQSVPLIAFLSSRSPEESKPHLAGFLRGLEAFGYIDGKSARIEYRWANGQYAAAGMGREALIVGASTDEEIDSSFSTLVQKRVVGLVVENDPFFDSRREHLIQLAAQCSVPAIYHIREFPVAGGLMSYGANLVDAYNQMGILVGRVLKGANIADLPVIRPTKFELALNLSTAKAFGLRIPATVLAIAEELID